MLRFVGTSNSIRKGKIQDARAYRLIQLLARQFSSVSADEYQYLHKSKLKTYHFQPSLPRLPVPKLEDTCRRYLEAQKQTLSESQFKDTSRIVKEFEKNEGIVLQAALVQEDARNKHTSYISEPWFDLYLRARVPILLNYNPFMSFADFEDKRYNDQLLKATNMVISALRFRRSLNEEVLEPEVYHMDAKKSDTAKFRTVTRLLPSSVSWYGAYLLFKAFPLDMTQFPGLFNATRVPGKGKDSIKRDFNAKHIVVIRNGNFYSFDALDSNGNIKEPGFIHGCLNKILNDTRPKPELSVSYLTAENRDVWADARKHLESNPKNARTLNLIDTALFIVCLDSESVGDNEEKLVRTFLHGDGANRWYDKSFQLVFCKDGKSAVHFEHSWGDGVAVLRFSNEIHKDASTKPRIQHGSTPPSVDSSSITLLEFDLDEKAKSSVQNAQNNFRETVKSLAVNAQFYTKFGKDLIKKHKLSPDSIMQLSFQSAYYKLTGKTAATYESCSTSAFRFGRTEVVRPATAATKRFSESVTLKSGKPSVEELKEILIECTKKHNALTKDAAMGQGFDRHLFGLRLTAEKLRQKVPALFQDPAYAQINHYILSTSTLMSPAMEAGGFGPVVQDGFGVGYAALDDKMAIALTSYPPHGDGKGFVTCWETALDEIHDVLIKTEPPK